MAGFGNGMKRRFFAGVEALGNKAAHLAKCAREKLETLNAEHQLEELSLQVAREARRLWESGESLPQPISNLLMEQQQLEAQFGKPEAEDTPAGEDVPDTSDETD